MIHPMCGYCAEKEKIVEEFMELIVQFPIEYQRATLAKLKLMLPHFETHRCMEIK